MCAPDDLTKILQTMSEEVPLEDRILKLTALQLQFTTQFTTEANLIREVRSLMTSIKTNRTNHLLQYSDSIKNIIRETQELRQLEDERRKMATLIKERRKDKRADHPRHRRKTVQDHKDDTDE